MLPDQVSGNPGHCCGGPSEVTRFELCLNALQRRAGEDEPDWQSELSSWKSRRRKQSEETLMRVAEINLLEEGETDPNKRKM